jgi:hypothetical protein
MVIYFQIPTVFWIWESLLSIMNVHGVNDTCQSRIYSYTVWIAVSEPSTSESEIKPACTDQIPTEFIQTGGRRERSGIHKLINSTWSKEELSPQVSITAPIYKQRTVEIINARQCHQLHTNSTKILQSTVYHTYSIKVISIRRWNCWKSSAWILTSTDRLLLVII